LNTHLIIRLNFFCSSAAESHLSFSDGKIFGICLVHFSPFQLLLQNHSMPSYQTYYKWSSRGSQEVLLLFRVIQNPNWLPWSLIGRDIFIFFFQKNCILSYQTFQKCLCLSPIEKSLFRLYCHMG
jgi:hypothetical protein